MTRRLTPPLVVVASLACLVLTSCGDGPAPDAPRRPHLLMIAVDTLRVDRLGAFGYERPTSPHIDALLAESVVFERALSASSWTLPSFAAVFTGLPGTATGCADFRSSLGPSYRTLAETLSAEGYRTGGVVSHVFLGSRHGLQQGFDDYNEELVFVARESHQKVSSPGVTERAIAWLSERAAEPEQPFFLLAHYFDPHFHYKLHPGVSGRFGKGNLSDRYDGEIAFTDEHIGLLLSALADLGLARDTVVVFVTDHGEEFFEHGQRGHGKALFQETTHMALAFRVPGLAPARIEALVSGVDVTPTLVELLGATPPSDPVLGRSLVPLLRGEARGGPRGDARPGEQGALLELRLHDDNPVDAYVQGRWKLIVDAGPDAAAGAGEGAGEGEGEGDGEGAGATAHGDAPHFEALPSLQPWRARLYDLEADPGEQSDVADQHPDVVQELSRLLAAAKARAADVARRHRSSEALELSDEELESLRELGYVR